MKCIEACQVIGKVSDACGESDVLLEVPLRRLLSGLRYFMTEVAFEAGSHVMGYTKVFYYTILVGEGRRTTIDDSGT